MLLKAVEAVFLLSASIHGRHEPQRRNPALGKTENHQGFPPVLACMKLSLLMKNVVMFLQLFSNVNKGSKQLRRCFQHKEKHKF